MFNCPWEAYSKIDGTNSKIAFFPSTGEILVEDINNGEIELDMLKKIKCDNIDEIIKFSNSDKMENNLWREETE